MSDKPYDSGNKIHVETKRTKRQLATDAERNRLSYIMLDPKGRAFMYELLTEAHIFRPSFNPESERVTCFKEGERNVGLRYLGRIQSDFLEEYNLMLVEHNLRK